MYRNRDMKDSVPKKGRPPLPPGRKRQKKSLTLPAELVDQAKAKAYEKGISLSEFTECAIARLLEKETPRCGGEGGVINR